jgi:hypothetical protein
MNLELRMFFVECVCGRDLRFDFLGQERVCRCGRKVVLDDKTKRILIAEHEERKRKQAEKRRELPQGISRLSVQHSQGVVTFEKLRSPSAGEGHFTLAAEDEAYLVNTEGELFSTDRLNIHVVAACVRFARTHDRSLWSLE